MRHPAANATGSGRERPRRAPSVRCMSPETLEISLSDAQRDQAARRARQLWELLEPVHGVVYFAPDARDRFEAIGLKGFWMGYFASRAAALGPVGPDLVVATFYVFNPGMVARALPDAWDMATPEAVLDARADLADATLRDVLGDLATGDDVAAAADLAASIARTAPRAGRTLAAAHGALPPPSDPLRLLWWAATVLREHRGDGHVAALLTADLDPCSALVMAAATGNFGGQGAGLLQTSRKWTDQDWTAATGRMVDRGWIDPDTGELTAAGRASHEAVEDATDRAAAQAFAPYSDGDLDMLVAALRPLVARIVGSGAVPHPNPIGVDPAAGLDIDDLDYLDAPAPDGDTPTEDPDPA